MVHLTRRDSNEEKKAALPTFSNIWLILTDSKTDSQLLQPRTQVSTEEKGSCPSPISIVCEMCIWWYLVSQQQSYWLMATVCCYQVNSKAPKLVDHKCPAADLIEVNWYKFIILNPASITWINVALTWVNSKWGKKLVSCRSACFQ